MNEARRERRQKLRVGAFVLLALAAFLGLIYALGARARLFEPRYTIHADFTEVGGLAEGATVRLAGVQIGRVSGVHLPGRPGGKVRVDLTIARRYGDRIRRNSVARIETQGLLGDKIVEITVGSAQAPPVEAGETLPARDPLDIGQVLSEGAETVKNMAALARNLGSLTETFARTGIAEDIAATTRAARRGTEQLVRLTEQLGRVADQIERGSGWAHALLYEEPAALRRLNDLIASTQGLVERVQRGEGAVGVLTSPRSEEAARKLLAAMEQLGRMAERSGGEEGLLPALLFEPRYRAVLDDLRAVARNFREVSERVAGGRGTLGSLVREEPGDPGLRATMEDLRAAVANLRQVTEKLAEGEGTLGALIADPTVYERLVAILDGAQRSRVLRFLLRGLGGGEDPDRRE